MTPEERIRELAGILARGYLRDGALFHRLKRRASVVQENGDEAPHLVRDGKVKVAVTVEIARYESVGIVAGRMPAG